MEASTKTKDGPIISAKKPVYLEGPKSRGYELPKDSEIFTSLALVSQYLDLQGLKKITNTILKQESLVNALQN